MFSWVIKVVPQPPASHGKLAEEDQTNASTAAPATDVTKKEEVKQEPSKLTEEVSEENSSQTGVLSWLSHEFSSALPQPVNSSKLANSEVKHEGNAVSSSNTSDQAGMIDWIVQGLGKVVPQPDEKYKGHTEPEEPAVPVVKVDPPVQEVKDVRDAEPLPHIPVVEVVSDEEPDTANVPFSPRVIEWIKHGFEKVVPQTPVHLRPPAGTEAPAQKAASAPVTPCKQEPAPAPTTAPPPPPPPAPAPAPAPAPPPAPAAPPAPAPASAPAPPPAPEGPEQPKVAEDSKGTNMVGWIVQGFGRIIPQPVLKPKEDSSDIVQNVCILQDLCDMVLEEVDSDWEAQQREQGSGQEIQAQEQVLQEGSSLLQVLPNILPHVLAMQEQEDAETQTERWTPLIESIKKEAEETARANIEERLQKECVEAARMAEDLARQAAELAIRQLEEEHTTQIIIDTKTEEPDNEQLSNIQEEENEEDPELQPLCEETEEESEDSKNTDANMKRSLVDICPAEPSPHESEVSDQAPQSPPPPPVTTQPQQASLPTDADQQEEPPEEGCGVPASCTGVKSWILRIPHASTCLKNNNVPLPKMPSDLLLLYQEMSQLPKQASASRTFSIASTSSSPCRTP